MIMPYSTPLLFQPPNKIQLASGDHPIHNPMHNPRRRKLLSDLLQTCPSKVTPLLVGTSFGSSS
jgi:hypothetical protein